MKGEKPKSLTGKGFHVKLKASAGASGYSEPEVAKALGVREPTVYRWFAGSREPGGILTCRMMLLFDIGPQDLVEAAPVGSTGSQAPQGALARPRTKQFATREELVALHQRLDVIEELLRRPPARPADGSPPVGQPASGGT